MFVVLEGGQALVGSSFIQADILICNGTILNIGKFDYHSLKSLGTGLQVLDAKNSLVVPGIVDAHLHLCGGSGEHGGFSSQTPAIEFTELLSAGVTTAIGTLGVDTTTRTMPQLFAKVKGLRDEGMSCFAYSGGYDIPPKTITGNIRSDIMFIDEIIGMGETAIADHRTVEPDLQTLAFHVVEAYVGGMLAHKAGVSHFHVGGAKNRLKTIRSLLENYEIRPKSLYLTHIERTEELILEAIVLSKKGVWLDFDIQGFDLFESFSFYKKSDGPLDKLSFSSDSGISGPGDILSQIKHCSLEKGMDLVELLNCVTRNPSRALKLEKKGSLKVGNDGDIVVLNPQDLEVRHVVMNGKVFLEEKKLLKKEKFLKGFTRRLNLHGSN